MSIKLPLGTIVAILIATVVLSGISLVLVQNSGESSFYYSDAQARLLMARRVCDSSSPGLAQLGAVWLPLTHVGSLPLICSDLWANSAIGNVFLVVMFGVLLVMTRRFTKGQPIHLRLLAVTVASAAYFLLVMTLKSRVFYTSGIGMTVISMMSYALLGLFMFKFVYEMTDGDRGAGLVAWAVVMLNPNMLYLQSTSMTELPMYFTVLISLYTFWRLSKDPSSQKWSFWSGLSCFAMCLVRYEGWVILLAETAIYAVILWRQRMSIGDIIGHLAYWGFMSWAGLIGWLAWNLTIMHNVLEFQNGAYAAPSNWVSGSDAAYGNLQVAFATYGYGIIDTVGLSVILGAVALAVYLLVKRLRLDSLSPLLPLAMIPFFGYMIYKGQRPMQAYEIEAAIYNIRFGLIISLTVAIMVGWFVQKRLLVKVVVGILVIASNVYLGVNPGIMTFKEAEIAYNLPFKQLQVEAGMWCRENYNGQSVLLEGYGNEQFQFFCQMNLKGIIYEGTYQLWEPVLNAPYANQIQWIVMRGPHTAFPEDRVYQTVRQQQSFWDHYAEIWHNDLYTIYELIPETPGQ